MATLPAKLFGLGLSRTGTTSLHAACVLLGIPSVHYPAGAARHWLAGRFDADCLADFDACFDIPTPAYFAQLDQAYPGSKFILTTRSADSWLDSAERHFANTSPPSPQTQLRDFIRVATYGVHQFHRHRFREAYERHHEAVRAHFARRPRDFLELDLTAGQGWAELCAFLGRPVPAWPFPHLSSCLTEPLAFVRRAEIAHKQAELGRLLAGRQ